jgi:hypothetical protein
VAKIFGPQALNELYVVWDRPEDIAFDQLPSQFVLKATAGSGWNVFCRDRATFDQMHALNMLRSWQRQNYFYKYREWQYRSLRSRIIAERLMFDTNHCHRVVSDYKIFCFNGQPKVLGVNTDRWGDTRHDFFDTDWNPVDYGLAFAPRSDPPLPKPNDLKGILETASSLSKGFAFVRVDLYRYDGRIIFGEMTFSPQAGEVQIQQPEADALFGSWLRLPR